MAWACVNNVGIPPESFLDRPPPYGWLSSPRYTKFPDEEMPDAASDGSAGKKLAESVNADEEMLENPDPESSGGGFGDFEFRLVDPVAMLTADELFSDGKLVPLHLAAIRREVVPDGASAGVGSAELPDVRRRNEVSPTDPYLFSPKAPGCTARWKKMLGLKKLYQIKQDAHKTTSYSSSSSSSPPSSPNENNVKSARNLKHLLHRASRLNASVESASLTLPLLKESENNDSVPISSRLSLSSSSSGHEHDDLPRLSLDSDKPPPAGNLSRVRLAKRRSAEPCDGRSPARGNPESSTPVRGVSVDSPRMNSYGKIVFHGLERSSSSPSTFNGGPRPYKPRGMERSYSANVRFAPVLNVPVCSLRGSSGVFGLFSTQQKKDGGNAVGVNNRVQQQQQHNKNRTDRT
ncbi:Unknown protein [Striga hermonthica]|uniref:Uncharacterized protein n=1 Tax=Striga hermonthica TaxID=68872 RepID=A0A9N7RR25_STRHE|nr:Unknown protein [Striga hermonthica]